jgi:hypothetical protein
MPTYSFRNTDTQEEYDKIMSISAKADYLAENPNLKQIFTGTGFLGIGDPVRLGLTKPDAGFRDVLKEVKSKHRGSHFSNIKNTINDF